MKHLQVHLVHELPLSLELEPIEECYISDGLKHMRHLLVQPFLVLIFPNVHSLVLCLQVVLDQDSPGLLSFVLVQYSCKSLNVLHYFLPVSFQGHEYHSEYVLGNLLSFFNVILLLQ